MTADGTGENTVQGSPGPDGPRLIRTDSGPDLIFNRVFTTTADEVWATLTDSDLTKYWFGPWGGEGLSGRTIRVQMVFEDGAPWVEMRVDACDRPSRLMVSMDDEQGDWRLEVLLAEVAGSTRLSLIHHLTGVDGLGEIGPGWEYYLDLFQAAVTGGVRGDRPAPSFGDYYPVRAPVFASLAEEYTRHAG